LMRLFVGKLRRGKVARVTAIVFWIYPYTVIIQTN
jgi:hypothetical protein